MKKRTRVLALSCLKGGVGKSTHSVNIASALSELLPDKKILLIDFDPQGSTSSMLGIPVHEKEYNITGIGGLFEDYIISKTAYDVDDIKKIIYRPSYMYKKRVRIGNRFDYEDVRAPYGFDVIPTAFKLSFLEIALTRRHFPHIKNVDTLLKDVVDIIKKELDYDYIIIDSMPSLGPLTVNVLYTSDYLVIPTTMTYSSVQGIGYVEELTRLLSASAGREISILGIAKNKYHKNSLVDAFIDEYLEDDFPEVRKFKTKIPESVAFEKMLLVSRIASHANKEIKELYTELTREILARIDEVDLNHGEANI